MSASGTDRIEQQVLLEAPRARAWRAVSDSGEFGRWFKVAFTGPFQPGATLEGRITFPGFEHLVMEITVEELVPERRLSFRWHPNAVDPGADYSGEPTTLVSFTLDEAPGGTLLTIVESGFDGIPQARRTEAFRSNQGGWAAQARAIAAHLGPLTRPA